MDDAGVILAVLAGLFAGIAIGLILLSGKNRQVRELRADIKSIRDEGDETRDKLAAETERRATAEEKSSRVPELEEDLLGVKTATVRGSRRATVTLGEPIPVASGRRRRLSATELTRLMEARVQALLTGRLPCWHEAACKHV